MPFRFAKARAKSSAGLQMIGLACLLASAQTASATPSLSTLFSFDGVNGSSPLTGLTSDAAGNLYGVTYRGGASNNGTIFKIDKTSKALTTLGSFDGVNAANAIGLTADAAGNLYGVSQIGGTNGLGSVFKYSASTQSITTLASFDGTNGSRPQAPPTFDGAGNLYGTTAGGSVNDNGTIYKIPAAGGPLTTVVSFGSNFTNGSFGKLTRDAAGNFYGTTVRGGDDNLGTVFKLPGGSTTLQTVGTFRSSNLAPGRYPTAGVMIDALGNIIGTTDEGGATQDGAVFKIAAGTTEPVTTYSFNFATTGRRPTGTILMDAEGSLYGTTYVGGTSPSRSGAVYKIPPNGGTPLILATFDYTNGENPFGGLIADADGVLYGTTSSGGDYGGGTVFAISGAGFVVPEPAGPLGLALCSLVALRRRRPGR